MPAYATANQRPTQNVVFDPVVYWRVSAVALSAIALLGIILAALYGGGAESTKDQALAFHGEHGLGLTWTHNVVHVALAAAAFVFGFGTLAPNVVKTAALVVGFVYIGLGVLGFLLSNPLGTGLALNLGVSLNAVHLLLGAWGVTVGFAGR